ncbi:uncharacterized protein LOC105224433 isoform X2 [Bactrocera dorsalis]|uniref:Uncharacterized protein LOC105224433 isoform X2 n=1 Tax=Bactrocera dorsalis TaxID=27457 RepID=A0ABM3K9M9_BACDO|nr:uncharacterized protein LOC105224433 isoform X2 [Bactrocera dorsalis]
MPKFLNAMSEMRRRRRRRHENELRFNCLDSKQENRTKTYNAQPKVVVNMDVCSPRNSSTIETSNFQSTAVVNSEPLEYDDDIYLTQLNSKDVCTSDHSKVGQLTYDKGQEFLYIKSEEIADTYNAHPKVVVNSQSEYDIPTTHVNSMDVCSSKNSSTIETSNFQSTAVVNSEPLEYDDDIYLTQLNSKDVCTSDHSKVGQLTYDKGQEFLYIKSEEIADTYNAHPKVVVNSQSEYDIPTTHVNSMDVCSSKNSSTIETSNFQSTAVVNSEPLEYDDDIYLTQLNSKDVCTSNHSKVGQLTYDEGQEFLCIKSEEIAEDKTPEVTDNFMLYEINARNSVVLNVNQLNTEFDKHTKNHASEIVVTQHLQLPRSENSKIRIQNAATSKIATANDTTTNRLIPQTPYFVEIPGKSSLQQKASSGRKVASLKINKTRHAKMLTNFSEGTSKCACHLNPMKNVDVHSNLELKDFFERMFEETRKLKLEDRQTIKTELLKAVSQAQEDVEAGKFCEKCYTMLAQPKKRC